MRPVKLMVLVLFQSAMSSKMSDILQQLVAGADHLCYQCTVATDSAAGSQESRMQTQQVIQSAYDIAKAAKQLVMLFEWLNMLACSKLHLLITSKDSLTVAEKLAQWLMEVCWSSTCYAEYCIWWCICCVQYYSCRLIQLAASYSRELLYICIVSHLTGFLCFWLQDFLVNVYDKGLKPDSQPMSIGLVWVDCLLVMLPLVHWQSLGKWHVNWIKSAVSSYFIILVCLIVGLYISKKFSIARNFQKYWLQLTSFGKNAILSLQNAIISYTVIYSKFPAIFHQKCENSQPYLIVLCRISWNV